MAIVSNLNSLQADLVAQLQQWAAANSDIKDFFAGSTGQAIIRLISGVGAFNEYRNQFNRRELSIGNAKLPSSVLQLARALGYNVNRKTAPYLDLTVLPVTTRTLTRDLPVATVAQQTAYVDAPVQLVAGQQSTVRVYLGAWTDVDVTAATGELYAAILEDATQPFTIDNALVYVSLNGTPLVTTPYIEDMDTASVVTVRTSGTGGIEVVFGDGTDGALLSANDVVHLRYFVTQGLTTVSLPQFQAGELQLSEITAYAVSGRGSNEDSLQKVQTLAPRYYQSLRRAVSKKDYDAVATSYPGILDAYVMPSDTSCCDYVAMYVREDYSALTTDEAAAMSTYIEKLGIMGKTVMCVAGTPIYLDLVMAADVDPTNPDLPLDLGAAMLAALPVMRDQFGQPLQGVLGQTFKIQDAVNLLRSFPGVLRAYITQPWQDKTLVNQDYFIVRSCQVAINTSEYVLSQNAVGVNGAGYATS